MLQQSEMKEYVERKFQNTLNNLYRLIKIPTVTAKGGEHSQTVITELERIFHSLNFETEIYETKGQPVFTATSGEEKSKTLLFYNHYDVQPAEPLDLWTSPPFEPEVRDGRIFGRGVADNKGEIIVRTSAIKMVQELTGDLPINIRFIIEDFLQFADRQIKQITDSGRK